jgi:hypothetical protein
MMAMSKDIKEVTRVNLIKNISPRRPTRGTTNLALQFPSCPLDATPTLRDGAHSIADLLFLSEMCVTLPLPLLVAEGPCVHHPYLGKWKWALCSLLTAHCSLQLQLQLQL